MKRTLFVVLLVALSIAFVGGGTSVEATAHAAISVNEDPGGGWSWPICDYTTDGWEVYILYPPSGAPGPGWYRCTGGNYGLATFSNLFLSWVICNPNKVCGAPVKNLQYEFAYKKIGTI